MPVLMTDEELAQAGMTEAEAKLELACGLFATGRISFPTATRLAGVTRTELETALHSRGMPVVRMEYEDFKDELAEYARQRSA